MNTCGPPMDIGVMFSVYSSLTQVTMPICLTNLMKNSAKHSTFSWLSWLSWLFSSLTSNHSTNIVANAKPMILRVEFGYKLIIRPTGRRCASGILGFFRVSLAAQAVDKAEQTM